MGQNRELLGVSGALEHILVSQVVFLSSSVGMGGVIDLFGLRLLRLLVHGINQLSDDGINRRLLLLGHSVEDLPKSGVVLVALSIGLRLLLSVLDVVRLLRLEVLILIAVGHEVEILVRVDHSRNLVAVIAMLDGDLVNESARVGATKHQADLDELTVDNIVALGPNMGRIDAHRLYITVSDHLSSSPPTVGVVQMGVGVNPILTNLKVSMPKDVLNVPMLVLPDQRYSLPVIRRKCAMPDDLVIRAPNIVLGGVAGEVALNCHFDYSPSVRKLGHRQLGSPR